MPHRNTARLSAATLCAAALALAATGCGTNHPSVSQTSPTRAPASPAPNAAKPATPAVRPTASAAGAATPHGMPTPAASPVTMDSAVFAHQAPFTGSAADEFGADAVMAGYKEMVAFSINQGFTSLMPLARTQITPQMLSFVRPWLTPEAETAWDQDLASLHTSDKAEDNVTAMTVLNLHGPGFSLRQPITAGNFHFTPATAAVEPRGSKETLRLEFQLTGDVPAALNGKPQIVTVTRKLTYWLVPADQPDTQRPWLIYGWQTTTSAAGKAA